MGTLEELAKEAMERVKYSKERSKEVIKRVEYGKRRSNSNDKYIS